MGEKTTFGTAAASEPWFGVNPIPAYQCFI